jgi:putative FmdB family regulatory protein
MPMYEYRCDECGREFEQLRRMSDADRDVICPECSSDHVRRLLSSFATSGCGAGTRRGFT